MAEFVTLNQIREAQAEQAGAVRVTPLLLAQNVPGSVYLKCENLQTTGAYKARAAFTLLNRLSAEQKRKGAALTSSGNFAGAFAYMGARLGVPTTLVMMQKTSPFKIEKVKRYGGEVVLCEDRFAARFEALERLRDERGLTVINHLEDPNVIVGHGTLGAEIVDQLPEVDLVIVPVSSGGLLAGVATAVKALRPGARVIGVNPAGSRAMWLAFEQKQVVHLPAVNTICDALTAQYVGALMLAHVLRAVDDIVLVSDDEVKQAMVHLFEHEKLVVEPGGAASLAALLSGRVKATGRAVAILSGGNVALEKVCAWAAERRAT